MGGGFSRPEAPSAYGAAAARDSGAGAGAGRKGMQLGKSKMGRSTLLDSLRAEGEAVEDVLPSGAAAAAAVATPLVVHSEPVFLTTEERLSVSLNKDGGLEGMEVQGTMSLTVGLEADACVRVVLAGGANPGYQFKTHPNIDKAAYSGDNVLGLKDPQRPFPTGAPLGVLKWRFQTADESLVPLTINCWPSLSGAQSYVNIEYEASAAFDLHNVQITVPLPALAAAPTVNSIDGECGARRQGCRPPPPCNAPPRPHPPTPHLPRRRGVAVRHAQVCLDLDHRPDRRVQQLGLRGVRGPRRGPRRFLPHRRRLLRRPHAVRRGRGAGGGRRQRSARQVRGQHRAGHRRVPRGVTRAGGPERVPSRRVCKV